MKRTPKPSVVFTDQANGDIRRCRLFLERKGVRAPGRRIREIYKAAWQLQHSPKLYPVEEVHAVSGLEFRRKNVGQFAIIYAFLEPSPSLPNGVVSIRRVRHGAEQDVLFRVEEQRAIAAGASRGLSTRRCYQITPELPAADDKVVDNSIGASIKIDYGRDLR